MNCPGCEDPNGGIYTAGCRACGLRDLARGPLFFASMRAGRLTPEYVAALRAFGDPEAVHAEVRAVAKQTLMGATRA